MHDRSTAPSDPAAADRHQLVVSHGTARARQDAGVGSHIDVVGVIDFDANYRPHISVVFIVIVKYRAAVAFASCRPHVDVDVAKWALRRARQETVTGGALREGGAGAPPSAPDGHMLFPDGFLKSICCGVFTTALI